VETVGDVSWAEVVWEGKIDRPFIGDASQDWDKCLLVRYPSRQHFRQHDAADMRVSTAVEAAGTVRARWLRPQQLPRHGIAAVRAPTSRQFTGPSEGPGLVPAPVSSQVQAGPIPIAHRPSQVALTAAVLASKPPYRRADVHYWCPCPRRPTEATRIELLTPL
jgi:hypothetical protein